MSWRRLGALGAGLAGVAAIVIVTHPRTEPNEVAGPARPAAAETCTFPTARERLFVISLRVQTRGVLPGSRDDTLRTQVLVQSRSGGLAFEVVAIEGGGEVATVVQKLRGARWVAELDGECAFQRVGVARDASPEVRALARNLALLLTTTLRSGAAWEASEPDSLGVVRSDYRRGAETLSRTRALHARVHGAPDVQLRDFRASARITPASSGWIEAVEVEESGRLFVLGQSVSVATAGKARSTERARGNAIVVPREPSWFRLDAIPEETSETAADTDDPSEVLVGNPLLGDGAAPTVSGAVALQFAKELAASLRRDATPLATVQQRILAREPASSAEIRAALFFALELAGTDAAQGVLRSVLEAQEVHESDHLHAIVALHGVRQPTDASLRALTQRCREDGLSHPRGRAALLALATWGARADSDVDRAARDFVRARLPSLLDEDPAMGLAVIQNLGPEGGFDDAIQSALNADDPRVRRAAVDATRVLPAGVAWTALLARFPAESTLDVTVDALGRLTMLVGDPAISTTSGDVARFVPLLASNYATVRDACVDFVGALSARHPEVRGALVQAFHAQRDPETRRRIGRYVTARDLAGGHAALPAQRADGADAPPDRGNAVVPRSRSHP